jgi:hypothetical protein
VFANEWSPTSGRKRVYKKRNTVNVQRRDGGIVGKERQRRKAQAQQIRRSDNGGRGEAYMFLVREINARHGGEAAIPATALPTPYRGEGLCEPAAVSAKRHERSSSEKPRHSWFHHAEEVRGRPRMKNILLFLAETQGQ